MRPAKTGCWGSCLGDSTAEGAERQRTQRTAVGVLLRGLCVSAPSAVLLCFAAPSAAHAQRYAFNVQDYAISLELPDSGSMIRASATISLRRVSKADTLTLDLLDLAVDRVTVNGQTTRFVRSPATIEIPLRGGSSFRVEVAYHGPVKDGLIVRQDSAKRWTYFGDNWPNRARHWIPSIDHPSDKATVTWIVSAPQSETVVANGRLVSQRDLGGRTETTWRESKLIPTYLMVIAAAPLVEYSLGETACGLTDGQRCLHQSVYTAPEQRAFVPGPFARADEIVRLFAGLVGPFPYEKLAHLQSSTRFGGMENASAIFYADEGFRDRTLRDGLVAHETAHQWFGDAVTERDWPHLWLSEGFATYFAALWTRAARGDSAFRGAMEDIRRVVLSDTGAVTRRPVIDTIETDPMALLNANSYQKGGFVLHMLRKQIGERAFFDAIREYYRKHKHSTAVTDDLRAEMDLASGQQLGWFFDQWLRRPGYPEVEASWSYDAGAREVAVALKQGGRFGEFEFPLTLAVVDSTGAKRRASVTLKPGQAAPVVRIPLATPPAAVMLDPDVELLAVVRVSP